VGSGYVESHKNLGIIRTLIVKSMEPTTNFGKRRGLDPNYIKAERNLAQAWDFKQRLAGSGKPILTRFCLGT
jgi:hypothetical protein